MHLTEFSDKERVENMRQKKILALALFVGGLSILNYTEAKAFTLPEGLSFNNVNLSGMSADEAKNLVDEASNKIENREVDINVDGTSIKSKSSEMGYRVENDDGIKEELDKYVNSDVVDRFVSKKELEKAPKNIELEVKSDVNTFKELVSKQLPEMSNEPVDAKITRQNNQFVITKEKDGKTIDLDQTFTLVDEEIRKDTDKVSVEAPLTVKEARIKESDLASIKDVLGTYSTGFASSSAARATNIEVGASKINGTVLMPGETLSGYELMQPFTVNNGYKTAGAYENGRLVDSVGGGVCQIATTLYNASLRAEVDITQRNNHSMTVSYVPASCDAAIAGTSKDLKIKNNYTTPIYVEAFVQGRNLTFNIWGKEDREAGRTIEFVPEVVNETAMGVTYQDDPTLPAGKEVKVSAGHNGRVSKLWKVVKINGVEKEKSLVSSDRYMVSNNIVKRGTGAAAPTVPAPSESGVTPIPGPDETQVPIKGPGELVPNNTGQ